MKRYRAIAEYYDAEYADAEMLQHDVPFFLGHLPRRPRSVLELAVGTARAAIPIAQAGHRVVGVDYAADMLAIARRKRDHAGLGDRNLRLVKGDLLKLDLGRRFDWVCLFFNTFLNFTTLDQQDRVLQAARAHLKRTGRFWLDIFQPSMPLLARPRSVDLEPHAFHVPSLGRTVMRTTDVRRDPSRQVQHIIFNYVWFGDDGQEHREQTTFELTFLFPRELRILLERNGLLIERLYGNYDGSRLNADSPRMIALCKRG